MARICPASLAATSEAHDGPKLAGSSRITTSVSRSIGCNRKIGLARSASGGKLKSHFVQRLEWSSQKGSSLRARVFLLGAPLLAVFLGLGSLLVHGLWQVRQQVRGVDHAASEAITTGSMARVGNKYERDYWELISTGERDKWRQTEEDAQQLQRLLEEFLHENQAAGDSDDVTRIRALQADLAAVRSAVSSSAGALFDRRVTPGEQESARQNGQGLATLAESLSHLATDKETLVRRRIATLEVTSRFFLSPGYGVHKAASTMSAEAVQVALAERVGLTITTELTDAAEYRVFANDTTPDDQRRYELWLRHTEAIKALDDLVRGASVNADDARGRKLVERIRQQHQIVETLTRNVITGSARGSAKAIAATGDQLEDEANLLDASLGEYTNLQVAQLQKAASGLYSALTWAEIVLATLSLLILAAGIAALAATKRTVASLEAMTVATRQIANGSLGVSVLVTSTDELGELAASFNHMARSLAEALDQRQRAEAREHLQAAALQAAANAIVITDPTGKIVWVNAAFTKLTGYSAEETIGLHTRLFKSGTQDDAFYQQLWGTITAGAVWHGEIENRRKDGSLYTEEMTITPVRAASGETTHFVAIKFDITSRRKADKMLRDSEERFALVVQATKDQVWDCELATGKMWRSATYWPHFGYTPIESEPDLGRWRELVHPDDLDRAWGDYESALAERHPSYESEYRFRRRDGCYAVVIDRGYILYDSSGNPSRVTGAMTDVTDQRHLEEQFRQGQKLEAVGKLAAGIAHDFNNLLMIISSSGQLLEMKLDGNLNATRDLKRILTAADRAAALTQQLLAFGRKQVVASKVVDLTAVVSDTTGMLERTIGEDIDFIFHGSRNLPSILADPSQVCQVVMNLCVNARDAMPRGGKLTVETREIRVGAPYCHLHPDISPGLYAALFVTDTGEGMSKETQQRVFEPFFTTKEMSKGTGLGLATVYGIVKQNGGFISVYSEPGQGSCFKVLFPATNQSATADLAQDHLPVIAGPETVMLVEDEDSLRESIADFLSSHGYKVLQASGAAAALELLRSQSERIDILLTDVVMPLMSGRQLAEAALLESPSTRVVYMSGYTDDAVVRHGVLQANVAFLQKPFRLADLATKLRETSQRKCLASA